MKGDAIVRANGTNRVNLKEKKNNQQLPLLLAFMDGQIDGWMDENEYRKYSFVDD